METTFYAFQSNLRYFLSQLLKDPINCKIGDFFKERNFSKKKLINILIKRDVIKRHEKIDDEENYNVKYNIIRKNFERKLKRIYNKYFETPDTEIDEATACGVSSGAFVQPLATPIKRKIGENIENMDKKRIFITEKHFEMLKETLPTFNAGDYQYTVPFPVKKNDPSMKRKPGFSMKRMK